MRVVLLGTGVQPVPPSGYGGVERTIGELARALTSAGVEVRIVQETRRGRSIDEYWFARDLPRLLKIGPDDVFHASTPVVGNRLAGMGVRFVYSSHSRHWFERRRPGDYWGAYLEKRAVRRATRVIALTPRLRAAMLRSAGPGIEGRLSIVPIGVDASIFHPQEERRSGAVAVGVGVIAPVKRWDLAARALRGSGYRLRLIGPIVDRRYGERVIAAGEEVELLGEVPEATLADALGSADLYVHPSRVELLSGAVLQAMAAGLPVLGSAEVGDLVRPGRTGLTAPPGAVDADLEAWFRTQALALRAEPNRAREWGRAGRAIAVQEYSWEQVARAHIEVYREVAAQDRASRR